ncbi:MAG: hypothetical protein JSW16_01645 [Dehalococcoidales bacterium]|nr:MAG: hypothetical protein JSW16_01645 [Dehalococcoidales bacterium]
MVGISIADVDDDQALDNARRTLLGTGAEIHIAKALQITPGKAVQHMGQYPPPPGVDAKS